MLSDRNRTFHIYQEEISIQVCQNIRQYFPVMKKTFGKLKSLIVEKQL